MAAPFDLHKGRVSDKYSTTSVLTLVVLVWLVSGRRGVWLVALVSPLIVAGLGLLAGTGLRWREIGWGCLIVAGVGSFGVAMTDISAMALVDQFVAAFLGQSQSSGVRYEQWYAMWHAFERSPLFGHGLGAVLGSIQRSDEMAWTYDLYYGALLFKIGLVGIAIYAFAVFWVYFSGIKLVRRCPDSGPIILPLLTGLAGFLLATATNPYLMKFDYLWVIFLPVAAINAYRHRVLHATSSSSIGMPVHNCANASMPFWTMGHAVSTEWSSLIMVPRIAR